MGAFERRLARELPRWVERGWVRAEDAPAILADASAPRERGGGLFPVIGAVLVGLGIILFVAANWSEIGKAAKIALLCVGIAASYAGAALADLRFHHRTAQALYLLGAMAFGAAVMLVGQIYHVPPDTAGYFLVCTLGALLTAALAPSQPALVLALAASLFWTGYSVDWWDTSGVDLTRFHWAWLPVWLAAGTLTLWQGWRFAGWLLPGAVAIWWTLGAPPAFGQEHASYLYWSTVLAAAVLAGSVLVPSGKRLDALVFAFQAQSFLFLVLAANLVLWPGNAGRPEIGAWGAALVVVAAFAAMLWRYRHAEPSGLLAAIGALALVLAAAPFWGGSGPWFAAGNILLVAVLIGLALVGDRLGGRWVGNVALAVLVLTLLRLYLTTFWGLMDRALFFLGGGVLILLLGVLVERRRRLRGAAA